MNHDVTPLQTALAAKGYDVGVIDGIFGEKTREAMRAYELAVKLTLSDQPTQELCDNLGVKLAPDFPLQPLSPKRTTILNTVIQNVGATALDYFLNFATSKINAVAIALVALAVTWINTRFGFNVPPDIQNLVTGWLITGGGAIIVWLRTFKNSPKVVNALPTTITTSGAAK